MRRRILLAMVFVVLQMTIAPAISANTGALPVQDPAMANTYVRISGVQDAVARIYELSADTEIFYSFAIAEFDSVESASQAVPIVTDRMANRFAEVGSAVQPMTGIEAPASFEGAQFIQVTHTTANGTLYLSDLIFAQGNRVYVFSSSSYQAMFDFTVIDLASAITQRPAGFVHDALVLTQGLWSALPQPSELPAGYQVRQEYVPMSFGPIPPA